MRHFFKQVIYFSSAIYKLYVIIIASYHITISVYVYCTYLVRGFHKYFHITQLQEYEKLQVLHRRAMTRVPEVKEALSVCQVPMSVKEAESLMQEDLKLKENLVNRIAEAELNIDAFMAVLESQGVEESFEIGSRKDYVTMREVLKEMMKDLKASQGQFDAFWTIHKARVDHMMRMCHFKRNAENVRR